jgi:Ser/Thr protein kinase RdoA (MazF antagonist)
MLIPFEQSTYQAQVFRLRKLAETALQNYAIYQPSLRLIMHWNNTTFAVCDCQNNRYILRISRPGFQDVLHVRSELMWLTALRRDTHLCVPQVVPALTGDVLTIVESPGVPQPRICVLFHHLPGRFYTHNPMPKHFAQSGVLMAHLHTHASTFHLPPHFTRKTWNADTALGNVSGVDQLAFQKYLNAETKKLYNRIDRQYTQIFQTLGYSPDVFGLIHADLHQNNILYCSGRVCAIDFDECGWGHYLHDIAIAFMNIRHHKNEGVLRQAFLNGYRTVRHLPPINEQHLNAFIAGRLLGLAVWTAGVTDHPKNRAQAARVVDQTFSELRQYF